MPSGQHLMVLLSTSQSKERSRRSSTSNRCCSFKYADDTHILRLKKSKERLYDFLHQINVGREYADDTHIFWLKNPFAADDLRSQM